MQTNSSQATQVACSYAPSCATTDISSRARPIWAALPAVALVCIILVPFLNKAFNIDDILFLRAAEQMLRDPLHPTAYKIVWENDVPVSASAAMFVSGPVTAVLLLPAVLLGGSEVVAHLVMLGVLCCGILAAVSLGKRLGFSHRESMLVGLFVACTPAVLGMSNTAMPDIPAMTFGVLGIERLIAAQQSRKLRDTAAATIFLAAAILSRSYAVMLMLPAAILTFQHRRTWYWWAPVIAAPAVAVAAMLIMRDPGPGAVESAAFLRSLIKRRNIQRNLIAFGAHWVVAVPLVLSWILLRGKSMIWAAALVTGPAVILLRPPGVSALAVVSATVGFAVLLDIFVDVVRRRDLFQAGIAAWLLLPIAMLPYAHLPAKYVVACSPAVALLIVRALGGERERWKHKAVWGVVASSALLGVLVIRADAELAGAGRSAAQNIVAPLIAKGEKVWFVGHWGFQWYSERAGARIMTRTKPFPSPGDKIVASTIDRCGVLEVIPRRLLLSTLTIAEPGGRIMSIKGDAGFYSNHFGFLPWTWSNSAINRFEVWQAAGQ